MTLSPDKKQAKATARQIPFTEIPAQERRSKFLPYPRNAVRNYRKQGTPLNRENEKARRSSPESPDTSPDPAVAFRACLSNSPFS
jgi:hypothetical protein